MGIVKLNTCSNDLYQMQYTRGNERETQIGSLCRLAAYITAHSRTILFQGMVTVNEQLAPTEQLVRYVDTDSIHLDLSLGFTAADTELLRRTQTEVTEAQSRGDKATVMQLLQQIVIPAYRRNHLYQQLLQLTTPDMLNLCCGGQQQQQQNVLLVDASRCGSFKIEDLVLEGYFLGSKQYAEVSVNVE